VLPGGHPLASPGQRLGAKVLDHLVLAVPSVVVTAALALFVFGLVSSDVKLMPTTLLVAALAISCRALVPVARYHAYTVSYRQRSLWGRPSRQCPLDRYAGSAVVKVSA
jgi:ABC-type transport system involved in cytochrome c biogenesis permease component